MRTSQHHGIGVSIFTWHGMRRYGDPTERKEREEALLGALALINMTMTTQIVHEPPTRKRKFPIELSEITEQRVLRSLVAEALRWQDLQQPASSSLESRMSPCSVCTWNPSTTRCDAPAYAGSPPGA